MRVAWLVVVLGTVCESSQDALCFGALLVNLPVRYLHIQLRENGINTTRSVGNLDVEIDTQCRIRWDQIDHFDGSYTVRIRVWSWCDALTITLRMPATRTLLCHSPIRLGKRLYGEWCDCPEDDAEDWMRRAGCPNEIHQLENDLRRWKKIDFDWVLSKVMGSWASPQNRYTAALCHYQIIDNQLYRRCFGEYSGFAMFVDEMLTSLLRKMNLPNTEFIFNLGDWPLQRIQPDAVPIVSWCGSLETTDIVVPTYELIKSVLDSMHRVSLDVHTAKGKEHWPWERKHDTAVFRGRDSSKLRLDVAMLSQRRPDLVEAGITRYFFFNQSLYPPPVKQLPFSHFFHHRYVLSIDGTVAAYRLPLLLAGDSVVLKATSPFYEHFYSALKPNLHYIPFDQNNIEDKIIWARQQNFTQMLQAKRQFVYDHLQPVNLYCYYATFIQEYSKRLVRPPVRAGDNMELVPRTSVDEHCPCTAHTEL